MDDFINLIGLCESYNIGLKHRIYHRDIIPPHLDPNRLEIRAILNQPSSESKEREKKFRKMFQLLRDRRYLIAHVFYLPPGSKHWHFFYFDQRDILETKNHWHYGPHIHLVNYLWPNYTAKGIWQQFMSGKPEIHGAEHIRWVGDFK